MRLLVIDDDEMTRLLMRETLFPQGFDIIEADNAEAGIALALEKSPDLVLLDIVMPGMDGIACLGALLERMPDCFDRMPVVMLTGMDDSTSIERSFAMGATDFIHKPIDWPLLGHRLRFVMRSHQLNRELQTSEQRLRLSMRAAKQSFFDLDIQTGSTIVSREYAAMLGYDPDRFEGIRVEWLERLHPDDRNTVEKIYRGYLAGEIPEYRVEFRMALADGGWKWVLSMGSTVECDINGAPLRMLGTYTDIDHLKQAEERLKLLATVFEKSGEGIMMCDANNAIVEVNQSFSNITGYPAEEAIGQNPSLLASHRHDEAFYARMWEALNENGYWQGEIWNRRKNGEIFPEWLGISSVRGAHDKLMHYIGIFSDITERKAAESKIEYLAHHDPLTRLPNRSLLADRFQQAVAQAMRNKSLVALMFLDLDRFKHINDTLGHTMGDRLLQDIAARLLQCLRKIDTICRQGGDEFIIILTGLREYEAVAQIAQKILQQLHEPFVIDGIQITTSFSIGISIYPDDGVDFLDILNKADTAMYAAKKQGRNTFRFFSNDMNIASIERINMENDLRYALENDQLRLYYQPQYAVKDNQLMGAEALLRWERSPDEMVPPIKFMSVAEDSGLIVPIGHWVLHEACRQNRLWHDKGAKLTVTVNVSAIQFKQGDLVGSVCSALSSSGLAPRYLQLELTESTMMLATEVVMKIMVKLKKLGVTFAVDNFGAKCTSLSYLHSYTVDTLKIDQSFISELYLWRQKDRDIVQALIQFGQTLRMQVIAQGIETEYQIDQLQQLGCDKVQGYYLSHPVPVEIFEQDVLSFVKTENETTPIQE